MTYLHCKEVEIPFYIRETDEPLLRCNNFIHKSTLSGPHNVLTIPHSFRITDDGLSPYLHTRLRALTYYPPQFLTFASFSIISYFTISMEGKKHEQDAEERSRFKDPQHGRRFAMHVHTYIHLLPNYMKKNCKREGVMTQLFSKALDDTYENCNT